MAYSKDKLFTLPLCEGEGRFSPDLKGLCEWLETQEPGQKYCINRSGECLFGQFHEAIGLAPIVSLYALAALYPGAIRIAAGNYMPGDDTFGAALSRARSALREIER